MPGYNRLEVKQETRRLVEIEYPKEARETLEADLREAQAWEQEMAEFNNYLSYIDDDWDRDPYDDWNEDFCYSEYFGEMDCIQ
jgi:hypothetical protein